MATSKHEPYRGAKPDPPARQTKKVACAFCDKKFATINAARDHEAAYHSKQLRKLKAKALEQ